jgi:hypothetical protein
MHALFNETRLKLVFLIIFFSHTYVTAPAATPGGHMEEDMHGYVAVTIYVWTPHVLHSTSRHICQTQHDTAS